MVGKYPFLPFVVFRLAIKAWRINLPALFYYVSIMNAVQDQVQAFHKANC